MTRHRVTGKQHAPDVLVYAHVYLLELAVGRASTRQSRLGAHAAHHLRLDLIGQMRRDDAGQQPLLSGHTKQSE